MKRWAVRYYYASDCRGAERWAAMHQGWFPSTFSAPWSARVERAGGAS